MQKTLIQQQFPALFYRLGAESLSADSSAMIIYIFSVKVKGLKKKCHKVETNESSLLHNNI